MRRNLTLVAADLVTLYGALALVLLVRYGAADFTRQWALHTAPFSVLFTAWLLAFYIANLYDARVLRNGRAFAGRLALGVAVAAVLSVLFFYLIPYFGITPKVNLALFIVAATLLVAGVRTMANAALAGGSKKRVLVVGATEEAASLARYIAENPQLGWRVRALVHLGQGALDLVQAGGPWELLDDRADLPAFIREHRIEMVVVSPAAYESAGVVAMLYGSRGLQVDFASLSVFAEQMTGTVPLGAISQQWFLENIAENSKQHYETGKRVLDVAVAVLLGIPVLVLTPFIMAAIWMNSPGRPFLFQERTGMHGTPFTLVKFRSMIPDAEKATGAVWAGDHDPRITRVGSFLRKSRLDELPQLWNVLKGDMSLVGPRAERPEIDARLARTIPFYFERYFIKPGLTGWAQINYPYVASPQDAVRRLEHDLYYIKHRSLPVDLEILLKTVAISLKQAGR